MSNELDMLETYLIEHQIPYKREDLDSQTFNGYIVDGGWHQIRCDGWNAVCHYGSYGYEEGLLEIMGNIVSEDVSDRVEGWFTADDVIERLEAKK